LIEFKLYKSVTEIPKESWDALTRHDIFLQTKYLEAASKALPKTIGMCYVAIFKDNQLVGVSVIQHVQLYLKDMFRHDDATCIKEVVQKALSKVLKGHILVVGNLTHTGQHGIYFNADMISEGEFLTIIFNAVKTLKINIKKEYKKNIRLILFKDYFEEDSIHSQKPVFDANKFYKLKVQPNMIMPTQKSWLTKQDYIEAMTSKYRTRYKRARKKRNSILVKELELSALKEASKTIYNLYKHVSNNASFNTFILPENHFLSLKKHLQDKFKIFGYYLENELIGFYSLILNNNILETYFLGYDAEHQHSNQLYLNMLYDMAVYAIENNFKTVVYARTAMEIKSSVGAKPKAMFMYLKYTNPAVNVLFKPIFSLMNPSQDWEQRHPFKIKEAV
jgi:hypothetical protein